MSAANQGSADRIRTSRRSDQAVALERAIQSLLAQITDVSIEGCWIDYSGKGEPTWIEAPAAAARAERAEYR